MSEIAFAAGFGSVRRFNAAILKTYSRTPRQIRRLAHQKRNASGKYVSVSTSLSPTLSVGDAFTVSKTSSDSWGGAGRGQRLSPIDLTGRTTWFVRDVADPTGAALLARIHFNDPRALFQIVERIRNMFDLNADWHAITARLATDPCFRSAHSKGSGIAGARLLGRVRAGGARDPWPTGDGERSDHTGGKAGPSIRNSPHWRRWLDASVSSTRGIGRSGFEVKSDCRQRERKPFANWRGLWLPEQFGSMA